MYREHSLAPLLYLNNLLKSEIKLSRFVT